MTISTAIEIAANSSPFEDYVRHVRQQKQQYLQQVQQRHQEGLEQAHKMASLLKHEFGVREVLLFGSLLDAKRVHLYSDIDLAVWGLSCDRYCEAVGTLLCNLKNFSIDLVMLETAQPSLLNHILTHGVSL